MKNYIAFVDDHSGSMDHIAHIALIDSNANMQAIADAASKEKLDTVVSQFALGFPNGAQVTRTLTISNPNVLKPATSWPTPGGTPLYDAIWQAIELHESLPDYNDPNVSVVVYITTDGAEAHSKRSDPYTLKRKIEQLQATGRWTFVARMPRGYRLGATKIGIPDGNILEWETSEAGMRAATAQTQTATASFYAARSAGAKSSTSFYTNAAAVNTSVLEDISKEVSLYTVPATAGRLEIQDFILQHRQQYLKGAAFYQLVKSEARVGPKKIILVRERATGKVFAGKDARKMLGLPEVASANARVHPGDHGNYDIFIQSESTNRLLPAGTGVIYWEKQGVPFTQADIEKFQKRPAVAAAPVVPQLPAVVGRTKPTPSPVPKASPVLTVNGKPVKWFTKREDARKAGSVKDGSSLNHGYSPVHGPNGERWFVYL